MFHFLNLGLHSVNSLLRLPETMVGLSEKQLLEAHNRLRRFPFFGALVCLFPQKYLRSGFNVFSEGQQLRYCGLGHGYDDIFVKGNPGDLKVSVLPSFRRSELT